MTQIITDYLQLIRAPAVFTALSNILAAHLILTQGDILWSELLLLMASSAALYSSGMVLNDWFDYDVDLQQRPSRPLPSGKITRNHALLFASILMLAGIALAALVSQLSFILATGIAVLVLLYDGLLKRTAAASISMAGCRYLNWILGFSLWPVGSIPWLIPVPVLLYIMGLTLLSAEEETATNRNAMLPTIAAILLAGVSIFAIARYLEIESGWKIIAVAFATVFIAYRLWQVYTSFTPASIQATMQLLILAIIPLDALLVLVFGPAWWALAVLALLLPGKLLARLMYVT